MKQRRLLQHTIFLKRDRYLCGSRKQKTEIINEIARDFKKPRGAIKQLFYRLRHCEELESFDRRGGRPKLYGDAQLIWWIETLWVAMGHMNSKSMKAILAEWFSFNHDPNLDEGTKAKILAMSASTMDRLLHAYRKQLAKKNRSGTRRGHIRFYEQRVPLRKFELARRELGHLEADTVAHCGGSLSGQFIWTLNLTDVVTGWCEQRAVWHKMSPFIVDAMREMTSLLPFAVLSIHTDNGMEFLNEHFVTEFLESKTAPQVTLTRSRAYHKNDSARIEQKNNTHVRRLLGYERLGHRELLPLINDLYSNEHRQMMNFFVPQRKLIEKVRDGSKTIKRYDKPKTPYQRVLEAKEVSETTKEQLQAYYRSLNPFEIRKKIDEKLKHIAAKLKLLECNSDHKTTGRNDDEAA